MSSDTRDRSTDRSAAAFARAQQLMPGGVSSPVRSFKSVGGTPRFIASAAGAIITDIDGNHYIDYVGSYGPMIAGHAHPRVVAAVARAMQRGSCFGAPTELETELAEIIISALPGMQMVRFVNSGTEAVMSAIRLARAATGRDLVIKCIGGYHGHVDGLLVNAGSGTLTLGTPSSPGVPAAAAANTLSVHYNDLAAAAAAFETFGDNVACFVVEPIAGNMGLVAPGDGYLAGLRQLCDQYRSLLLFDEVMTGFRVAWGGAQTLYNVRPDITCLGKVIGGGMPVGAYAASTELMRRISPDGPVYQAGTLSGNPIAMTAGIETLRIMQTPGAYEQLEATSHRLESGLRTAAAACDLPIAVNRVGAMICPFVVGGHGDRVTNYTDATRCNATRFARFFHAMLDRGVNLPPSQFESWFVSLAHTDDLVDQTIAAARWAFATCG